MGSGGGEGKTKYGIIYTLHTIGEQQGFTV